MKQTTDQTKAYYEDDYFYMSYKQLATASHWVDPCTGEVVKLSHNIKAVYSHKLDQYRSFSKRGMEYLESHQRVADLLGVSLKVVVEVAVPLLKRMGLIHIEHVSTRKHITTMFPLQSLRGELINPKMAKHLNKQMKKKKVYKDKITYDQLKTIRRNKKKIEKMKTDMKEEYFILTKEEMERLIKDKDLSGQEVCPKKV